MLVVGWRAELYHRAGWNEDKILPTGWRLNMVSKKGIINKVFEFFFYSSNNLCLMVGWKPALYHRAGWSEDQTVPTGWKLNMISESISNKSYS